MTADIINLNKFRKARERAEAAKRADTNRFRFGRTNADKEAAAREEQAKNRILDDALLPSHGLVLDDDIGPGTAS